MSAETQRDPQSLGEERLRRARGGKWQCQAPRVRRRFTTVAFASSCALLLLVLPVHADPPRQALTARGSLGIANGAADAWSDDAQLVWVENDAPVDQVGRAAAWGFLFYSPNQGAMRSYSVREGVIVEAEDHAVTARAPGLGQDWIDSARAVEEARKEGGDFCVADCELQSLLLVRGVFDLEAAWVAVFAHATGPRLYVVLDAESARFVRRWRG